MRHPDVSLTSLLGQPAVRKLFRDTFPFKPFDVGADLAAPPVTRRYAAIGTAFDYLARWWLRRRFPDAVERPWVAESCVECLESVPGAAGAAAAGRRLVGRAREEYGSYLDTGEATDGMFRAAFGLVGLDSFIRSGRADGIGSEPGAGDIADLRQLWDLLESGDLGGAWEPVALNPTFGRATDLVGGADADIIADDMIIDIKTTKSGRFTADYYHQLVGYWALSRMGGVDGLNFTMIDGLRSHPIGRLGVYFSRHGALRHMSVPDIGDRRLEAFLGEFGRLASLHARAAAP